jgi:peptidylprolyl isomerase
MQKRNYYILAAAIIIIIIIGGYFFMNKTKEKQEVSKIIKQAVLETTKGNIIIELDQNMPVTSGNFEKLVKQGFYDGAIFHRIIKNFMIQGGDPTGTGRGGPGYMIKDEFTQNNRNDRGTISMANAGPNTGGSQFFINLVNNNFLDSKHPVFGKVIEGMEVVDAIARVKTGVNDKPLEDVKIIKAYVE